PLLGPLAIVDVGSRSVPAHDASLVIAERGTTDEVPPVLAILATDPDLEFEGRSGGEGAGCVPHFREVVRVIAFGDADELAVDVVAIQLLRRTDAPELERRRVRVEQPSAGVDQTDVLRDDIEKRAQLAFVLPDLFHGLLPIVDVGPGDVPADDASSVVAERDDTNEEPAVLAVPPPEARFGLPR